AFYDNYFKDFIKGDILNKILASYKLNGVAVDFSGEELEYKKSLSVSYPAGERFMDGKHAPGAIFVRDGRKLICLGRVQGLDLVVDRESGAVVSPEEFGESMSAKIAGDEYVLTIGDGNSTVTYMPDGKTPYADSLSEEEFLLIASEYKSKYPNNTLESSVWNSQTPVPREKIEALLRDANVTSEDEQGEFIRLVYDEKTDGGAVLLVSKNYDSGTGLSENFPRAEKILKDAMCRKVRSDDFTYYGDDNRLKEEYRSMKFDDPRLADLERLCGKYDLCSYANCRVEVVYSREAYFPVQDGKIKLLTPKPDSGLEYEAIKLEFPDKNSVFNSAMDFSQENILASKEDLLHIKTFTMPGNLDSRVSVCAEEFLYGGKNGWFYGIWTGSEKENRFTESALNRVFRNADTKELDEYSNAESEDDIKSSGEKVGKKIGKDSSKKDVAFVCLLPEKEGNILKGITSQYIEETVYDDGGVPNVRSKTIESKPYVGAGTVACNRLGGNAYFAIEGVPGCTSTSSAILQKSNTSGTDTTIGPQVCFIGLSNNTETENEGFADMVQTLQDVNGDRIPDVVKKVGGEWHIYFGSVDSIKNIEYPVEPSLRKASHGALSKNYNNTTSYGFSFSPQGAVISRVASNGRQRSVSQTNGFGKSWFSGKNSTEASILDINADGIADYVNENTVYLGTGEDYKTENKTGTKFAYGWDRTGRGAVSGESGSATIAGISIGDLIDKGGAGQDISTGASADIGGCSSVSTSTQSQMLLDMNGDGLPDVVRKAEVQNDDENCIYEVYYNTGALISSESPVTVRIPKWKDIKLTSLTVSNRAINSNGMSGGGKSVILTEKETFDISSAGKDIENLDCSITASTNITGNASMNINVSIPIPNPITYLVCNITANEGGGMNSGSTSTSATVRMLDLDGDGLADQVLKISGGGIYWKRNLSGKIGLLKQVNLPQGGSVEIGYAEKYGTVYNPNFKYVMGRVTVNDGTDGEGLLPRLEHGGHSVTTLYDYDGGYYDRQKKEFYGFKTVRTTLADGPSQTDEYYNLEYYSKGCTKKSSSHSKDGQLLSESRTELCPSPVALPLSEESWNYEMSSGNAGCIHTSAEYEYDGWGNCTKVTQD
ncbi:MAG: hypothetical protein J6W60_14670, partial [Treponema sp.]|nr:hypothetical protein [Treponema sp.]